MNTALKGDKQRRSFGTVWCLLLSCLISGQSWAAIEAPQVEDYLPATSTHSFEDIREEWRQSQLSHEDVAKIIPIDLHDEMENDEVVRRIADRSAQHLLNQEFIRNRALGQAKERVEKQLSAEMTLGEVREDGFQHRLALNLDAFQTRARVNYQGFLNASLSYSALASETHFELRESLRGNYDFIVEHSRGIQDEATRIKLSWQF